MAGRKEMHQHGGNRYQYQNIIDFSANTNLAGIPAGVAQAARDAITCSDCYPDPACTELVEAISGHEGVSSLVLFVEMEQQNLFFSWLGQLNQKKPCFASHHFMNMKKH